REDQARLVVFELASQGQPHEEVAAPLVELTQREDLPRRRKPVHGELGPDCEGDRATDLDLETGFLHVLAGKWQIRPSRAQPDPAMLAARARGRDQEDGDREGAYSQSLSPKTTTTSLKFVLRAGLHLGSLPNHTWDRTVPPAATATYCLPSTA